MKQTRSSRFSFSNSTITTPANTLMLFFFSCLFLIFTIFLFSLASFNMITSSTSLFLSIPPKSLLPQYAPYQFLFKPCLEYLIVNTIFLKFRISQIISYEKVSSLIVFTVIRFLVALMEQFLLLLGFFLMP